MHIHTLPCIAHLIRLTQLNCGTYLRSKNAIFRPNCKTDQPVVNYIGWDEEFQPTSMRGWDLLGLRSTGASFDIIYLTLQGKIICSSFKAHLYIFIPPSKMAKRFVAIPHLHVFCPRPRTKMAGSFVLQPPNPPTPADSFQMDPNITLSWVFGLHYTNLIIWVKKNANFPGQNCSKRDGAGTRPNQPDVTGLW